LDLAARSLQSLDNGVYLDPKHLDADHVRQWCGIFACAVLVDAGIGVPVTKVWNRNGIKPGDIAVGPKPLYHHFIILAVGTGTVDSLDGNTDRQKIRPIYGKPVSYIENYYQIHG
jgi:hypothetical protein